MKDPKVTIHPHPPSGGAAGLALAGFFSLLASALVIFSTCFTFAIQTGNKEVKEGGGGGGGGGGERGGEKGLTLRWKPEFSRRPKADDNNNWEMKKYRQSIVSWPL